jgi:hypothetical protein
VAEDENKKYRDFIYDSAAAYIADNSMNVLAETFGK